MPAVDHPRRVSVWEQICRDPNFRLSADLKPGQWVERCYDMSKMEYVFTIREGDDWRDRRNEYVPGAAGRW